MNSHDADSFVDRCIRRGGAEPIRSSLQVGELTSHSPAPCSTDSDDDNDDDAGMGCDLEEAVESAPPPRFTVAPSSSALSSSSASASSSSSVSEETVPGTFDAFSWFVKPSASEREMADGKEPFCFMEKWKPSCTDKILTARYEGLTAAFKERSADPRAAARAVKEKYDSEIRPFLEGQPEMTEVTIMRYYRNHGDSSIQQPLHYKTVNCILHCLADTMVRRSARDDSVVGIDTAKVKLYNQTLKSLSLLTKHA
jgi:hypothetical protein